MTLKEIEEAFESALVGRGYDIAAQMVLNDVYRATGLPGFVAGGFVRDMILGGNPKDMDVFLPVHNNSEAECGMRAIHEADNFDVTETFHCDTTYEEWSKDVQGVTKSVYSVMNEGKELAKVAVDLIFIKVGRTYHDKASTRAVQHLHTFDFGISQVGMLGSGELGLDAPFFLQTTEAFRRDLVKQVVTFMRAETEGAMARSLRRLVSLMTRPAFQGWGYGVQNNFAIELPAKERGIEYDINEEDPF